MTYPNHRHLASLVVAFTVCASARAAEEPIGKTVLIVHPSHSGDSVSQGDIRIIFLGKKKTWEDGTPVLSVDLPPESPVREAFSQSMLGQSTASVKAYWYQLVFWGKATPPPHGKTEADVVRWVSSHPGAVGYVSRGTQLAGVKVLKAAP